ncbi:MAG: SHOCT domain-containing protein [Candidatus Limnocylindrales bacterium]|jgi:uncharacterized membrane protein
MYDLGSGFVVMWFLSVVIMLAIPVAIVWLLVVLVRNNGGRGSRRYDPAAEQLRYRYARGEISQAEFEQGMHLLGYERRQ